jgi:hypothetical protein
MIENGNKYLITADNWFIAPDGESYRAIWGTCVLKLSQEVFGFTPLRPSTNWFVVCGKGGKEIIIAGCQIHYAIRCEDPPTNKFQRTIYQDKDTGVAYTASRIYFAEGETV